MSTTARLDALNISVRLMKWPSSGMSNTSWLKNRMVIRLSKGVSIRDTTTSKYSLSPLKESEVRAGRATHVIGRGCRLALSAGDRGDRNSSVSSWSLVNVDRVMTITSGEMYPE